MDDIMVLFHKIIVDLGSFNQSQFGIFNESERDVLRMMFVNQCDSMPFKFFAMLTPEQKHHVVVWACQRSTFSVDQLISGLKKFTKYLENVTYTVYPRSISSSSSKTKKKGKKYFGVVSISNSE